MSVLNWFVSKDTAEENLQSSNQPVKKSVLPRFSGELSVDENLKLSHKEFKETIYDYFIDKNITPLSQLRATPPFPTPHVLAQFAFKAYTGRKTGETDAQYEICLDLPKNVIY